MCENKPAILFCKMKLILLLPNVLGVEDHVLSMHINADPLRDKAARRLTWPWANPWLQQVMEDLKVWEEGNQQQLNWEGGILHHSDIWASELG